MNRVLSELLRRNVLRVTANFSVAGSPVMQFVSTMIRRTGAAMTISSATKGQAQ
jgi:hypothetical protein